MATAYPVIWAFHGAPRSGRLEVRDDGLELASRRRTLFVPAAAIRRYGVERGVAARMRGLRAVAVTVGAGDTVRIASLGGVGSLNEIVTAIGRRCTAQAGVGT